MRKQLAAVLLAIFLAGCAAVPQPTTAKPATQTAVTGAVTQQQATPPAQAEPAPKAQEGCLAEAPQPPKDARRVTVRRVVDGDTVELADGTKTRLIGINTPETVDPRKPVEAYGKEASAYTKQALEGKEVILSPGRQPQDKYGRQLAWLWLTDGSFFNALLVRDGYAQVSTYADNPDHAELLLACQREAREQARGLWGLPAETAKAEAPAPQPAPAPTAPAATGVTITREPGTVSAGSTASVSAKAAPGVTCSITVMYKSGASTAQGLGPKTTSGDGSVSWSWKVGTRTTPGSWPVTVTCGGQSARTAVTVR